MALLLLRSAKMNDELIDQLFKEGSDFSDQAFMSTTYSERAFHNWMKINPDNNVLFKVYSKSGKLIEASSSLKNEAKVLFNNNKLFNVQKVNKGARHPLFRNEILTEIILKEI